MHLQTADSIDFALAGLLSSVVTLQHNEIKFLNSFIGNLLETPDPSAASASHALYNAN